MSRSTWVFGYGSLVAPASIARTIGRPVTPETGFVAARLRGFGRAWNYGSLRQRADWDGPHGRVVQGVVVCLGLERHADLTCNGALVRVDADELAALDRRESDYDRVEVGDQTEHVAGALDGPVVTYVPRPSAVERYAAAKQEGRAAIRHGYVELVVDAFRELGNHHHDEYHASTPEPDVPIVRFESPPPRD